MKSARILIVIPIILTVIALTLTLSAHRESPRLVDVGGHRLRTLVLGEGDPTVVFETFGPAPLEFWTRLQHEVSPFARTFSYDHGGAWGSEAGPTPRDARRIAEELRAALHGRNLPPPYVLVGYSFGGPYVRVFADRYPDETAALVLVDPTQEDVIEWLQERYDVNRVSPSDAAAQNEKGMTPQSMQQAREAQVPAVPVILLTGAKAHDAMVRRIMPRWIEGHRKWLRSVRQGRHIITHKSGHGIPMHEPELVVEAIREALMAYHGTISRQKRPH